jgi:hypothetical protein
MYLVSGDTEAMSMGSKLRSWFKTLYLGTKVPTFHKLYTYVLCTKLFKFTQTLKQYNTYFIPEYQNNTQLQNRL